MNNTECHHISFSLPDNWILHVQCAFAGEIVFINCVIVAIFLRPQNITPVTILLSALAISDLTSAVFSNLPNVIAYYFYQNDLERNAASTPLWDRKYPECVVFSVIEDMSYMFHMMSVLITTLLCIQKAAVLKFPLWGKTHLNNKSSYVGVLLVIVVMIAFFLPFTAMKISSISPGDANECCYSLEHMFVQNTLKSNEGHLNSFNTTTLSTTRNTTILSTTRNTNALTTTLYTTVPTLTFMRPKIIRTFTRFG